MAITRRFVTVPVWVPFEEAHRNRWCQDEGWEARIGGFALAIGKNKGESSFLVHVLNLADARYYQTKAGAVSVLQAQQLAVLEMVRQMSIMAYDATWNLIEGNGEMARADQEATNHKCQSALMDASGAVIEAGMAARQASPVSDGKPPKARSASGEIKAKPAGSTECKYCGMRYKDHPGQGAGAVAVCNVGKVEIE